MVHPQYSESNAHEEPPTWKSGMGTKPTLFSLNPNNGSIAALWASRPRWVSMAPLGKPVVPEV